MIAFEEPYGIKIVSSRRDKERWLSGLVVPILVGPCGVYFIWKLELLSAIALAAVFIMGFCLNLWGLCRRSCHFAVLSKSGTLSVMPWLSSEWLEFDLESCPQGEGVILNDDVAELPGIRISDVTQEETNDGVLEFVFNVELTGVFDQLVTVDYESEEFSATSARDGRDFFRLGQSTLFFEPGEVLQQVIVQVMGDTDVESDETFFVNLFGATNAEIIDDQGAGLILNDDFVTPLVSIDDVTQLEGDVDGTLTFTVSLDKAPQTTATVDFTTADGTAFAGSDFTATSGTLTFNPGETSKTIDVTVLGDVIDEIDKQFFINLSNANGLLIDDDQGRATMIDDDDPDAIIQISDGINITQEFGKEGNAGLTTYEFTVEIIGKPTRTVTVALDTESGTATAGSDFLEVHDQLTFEVGEFTKTIQVDVLGDASVEPDEEFFVNLSNADGVRIFDDQGVGTIINDDAFVVRQEGLDATQEIEDRLVEMMGAEVGSKDFAAPPELLLELGLEIIERLGLTEVVFLVADPVDVVITTPQGRSNGFQESTGVVSQSPNSFYSGDGATELIVLPNASQGTYNLSLAGVGSGEFSVSAAMVTSTGQVLMENVEGTLAGGGGLELALDFTATPTIPTDDPNKNIPGEVVTIPGLESGEDGDDALAIATDAAAALAQLTGEQEEGKGDSVFAEIAQLLNSLETQAAGVGEAVAAQVFSLPGLDSIADSLTDLFDDEETTPEKEQAQATFLEAVWSGIVGAPGKLFKLGSVLDMFFPDQQPEPQPVKDGDDNAAVEQDQAKEAEVSDARQPAVDRSKVAELLAKKAAEQSDADKQADGKAAEKKEEVENPQDRARREAAAAKAVKEDEDAAAE